MSNYIPKHIITDPIRTRQTENKPLPKYTEADEVIVSKINLTRMTIDLLKKACREYGAKTYNEVKDVCTAALDKKIYVEHGRYGKVSARNYKGFEDKFEFLLDKTASELEIYPEVVNSLILDDLKKDRKPNPVEFLYCTYLLMPDLDPNHFSENMNNIRTAVNTLWDRLTGEKYSSLQSMLYLYSAEGGTGKNIFQTIIRKWAENKHIRVVNTRVPHNQFVGDEFNKNAICFFSEIHEEECDNWSKMNDLIDGGTYIVEKKGENRYELKAQAFLIGSSNFIPKDANNRRIINSIVYYGSTKLVPLYKHPEAFKLEDGRVDIKFYDAIVDKWLKSCPEIDFDFSKYDTGIESTAKEWENGLAGLQKGLLHGIADYIVSNQEVSKRIAFEEYEVKPNNLANRMNAAIDKNELDRPPDRKYGYKASEISNLLKELCKNKKVVLAKDSTDVYQKVYNIKKLVEDAGLISESHSEDIYKPIIDFEYDYRREKQAVIDVANAILKEKRRSISKECRAFLKGKDSIRSKSKGKGNSKSKSKGNSKSNSKSKSKGKGNSKVKAKESPSESPKKTLPTEIEKPMLNVGTLKTQSRKK